MAINKSTERPSLRMETEPRILVHDAVQKSSAGRPERGDHLEPGNHESHQEPRKRKRRRSEAQRPRATPRKEALPKTTRTKRDLVGAR